MHKNLWLLLLLVFGLSVDTLSNICKITLSSAWHSNKKTELLADLHKHESSASKLYGMNLDPSKMRAIIVPHAGLSYSGDVAAAAYRLVKPGVFKRVILLAPSHYKSFNGVALPAQECSAYKTSLGVLNFDVEALQELSEESLFEHNQSAHELEHGLAMQLPFIQKSCGADCKLIPLVVGQLSVEQALSVASTLQPLLDDETLLVVSSDFTHYGQRFDYVPFKNNITQQIFGLDSSIVSEIENKSLKDFKRVIDKTGATVCGRYPIMVLLGLLEQGGLGDVDSYVVGYDTSVSGQSNPDHSVSYLSLVISNEKRLSLDVDHHLTGYEKRVLLQLARRRLDQVVKNEKQVAQGVEVPGLLTDALRSKKGAFVTLNEFDNDGNKNLCGCIGTLAPEAELYKAVYNMTKSAAKHDNRFKPVQLNQLDSVQISISVLTPPIAIPSYQDIELGRDGIILKQGVSSAVYLPKVAVEQGWKLQRVLESLGQKAGLSKDAFKDPKTKFQTFQSIDFAEDKDFLDYFLYSLIS